MVASQTYQTNLQSHMIFNGIRNHLTGFQVQALGMNKWCFILNEGNSTTKVDVHFDEFEKVNRVFLQVNSVNRTMFSAVSQSGVEQELIYSLIKRLENFELEVQAMQKQEEETNKMNRLTESQSILRNSVNIMVPEHVESDTQSSLFVEIKNTSSEPILNFTISFPDSEDFFTISGELKLSKILPGIEIEHIFTIKPKFHKGTFPLCVKLDGNAVSAIMNYSVKVGGTEIY